LCASEHIDPYGWYCLDYHVNQADNEELDESKNQEIDNFLNDDPHYMLNYTANYIYARPLDVACAVQERPSLEILTNGRPPLHFLCKYSRTPWIPTRMNAIKYVASIFPDDGMRFYHGVLPFHWVCRSQAPRSVLKWWCEQYPTVISARTSHTHEMPLHCFLSSTGTKGRETATDDQLEDCEDIDLSALQYLVEKHPDALTCTNRMGWLPFHLAALHDLDLDVVFYLICQNPLALQTDLHRGVVVGLRTVLRIINYSYGLHFTKYKCLERMYHS